MPKKVKCRTCDNLIQNNNKSGQCWICYTASWNKEKKCIKCNEIKPSSEFTPTSVYCKKCLSIYTNKKWTHLKELAIEYKGGKCEICGYRKCNAALEFHHINMQEKEFTISKVRTLSLDVIKPELDKCMLLCANCHREQHQILAPN